ncbi:hypothetical protein H4Q32_021359 [Labeo rohita]|uniref:Uncharacterized protein n=1 Tax=Labeo rohita TaxID=84645 RepID=A0ABQ8MQR0_LABRO|nr:hypothetical protein H4Q32_021359 [Labeo rohita]
MHFGCFLWAQSHEWGRLREPSHCLFDLKLLSDGIQKFCVTIKTVLLALTSLKRVGDLQALSVAPSHLDFAPGMAKAFLYPRPGYVPKVPSSAPRPVILQAFCPPPFQDMDQQKLNCMCPVRALDTYVHRAAVRRRVDQLFVCYGPPKRGLPASKQTLSRWIVDAISQTYNSLGLPFPLGVKAHSTRGIAASKAFFCLMQLEFLKGNVSGYTCNPGSPKGTRRCVSGQTSGIPASVRFFVNAECWFRRTCFYASWSMTSPACDISPLYWTAHTHM